MIGIRCVSAHRRQCAMALPALLALVCSPGAAVAENARPFVPVSFRNDATLFDICFVDTVHGWAVGDRGTIWHTADGGQHWMLQESGVETPLRSVCFLDALHGWAAGGSTSPLTHHTTGVLLRTRDGGRTWSAEQGQLLPSLRKIRFFTPADGWAIGEPSALFPSGVFATDNGGRSWTPLASGARRPGWLAGDFVDPLTGALSGRLGALGVVRRRGVETTSTPSLGLRGLHDLRLTRDGGGWLTGDGGLVMTTTDGGSTWQTPAAPLPDAVGDRFDWRALAIHGDSVWVAGNPGTRVLHSGDGGHSWKLLETGQNLPVQALTFSDERHGWAVGALGTILATTDGGRTWRRQRAGGTRAALAGFCSEPGAIPFELLTRLSGNDGYLSVIEILARRDAVETSPAVDALPERSHEAVVAVGGCVAESAWRFPLRQQELRLSAEQLREGWDRMNDGAGMSRLEAYLVRELRCWRPDVVFAPPVNRRHPDPLDQLIGDALLRAVAHAADPTRYPEQVVALGLEPWRVKKVFLTLSPGESGTVNLATAQLAPRLGVSLSDHASPARAIVERELQLPPTNVGFRLVQQQVPESGHGDFFSGLTLHPGGEARRSLENPTSDNSETLRRAAQKHRNVQAILARSDTDVAAARLNGQVQDLISGIAPREAGHVLHQLAQRHQRSGRWELAAEAMESLAQRYPNHSLTPAAQLWLVQYYSSGEVTWRNQRGSQATVQRQTPAASRMASTRRPDGVQPASLEFDVQAAAAVLSDPKEDDARWKRCADWAKAVERTSPVLFAEPGLRFPLAVTYRNQGLSRQAERFYLALRHGQTDEAWVACAAGERWLADPKGRPPKPITHCRRAESKPRLDGSLDEPIWTQPEPAELHSALEDDTDWHAVARFAYDDEFLYLAARCRRATGAKYEASSHPRPRDSDLSEHDRIDFCLDLDRDGVTYYRLSVDHRGWTSEECWGDRTWDPQWFVAAADDDEFWTVEAAIPLAELTGQLPASRSAWSVGVQRVVPGVGFQSWTKPAAIHIRPEGCGYLLFD